MNPDQPTHLSKLDLGNLDENMKYILEFTDEILIKIKNKLM